MIIPKEEEDSKETKGIIKKRTMKVGVKKIQKISKGDNWWRRKGKYGSQLKW